MKDIAGQIKRKNIPFHGEKEAFSSFVNRVTGGKYTDKVRFSLIESASGFDEYVLTVTDGIIDIKATSGTAAVRGVLAKGTTLTTPTTKQKALFGAFCFVKRIIMRIYIG